jgi:opacity protein-like surface antigen
VEFSGWYIRGDIGMTNQRYSHFTNPNMDSTFTVLDKGTFDSGMLFAVGVGYQFNSWLRLDGTFEYRGKTTLRALDSYPAGWAWNAGSNEYTVQKSEWVGLANLYVDLGTWWCVTPFVGAGVGAARVELAGYRDVNVPNGAVGFADPTAKWNFAWAAYAGLAYKVTPNFSVELAYRYLHIGDATTADTIGYLGQNTIYNPTTYHGIYSQDVKLGVRWLLSPPEPIAPPVLVRKG